MDSLLKWLRLLGYGAFAVAAAAVPDLTLLCLCLGLWIAPRFFGVERLEDMTVILALEFFAVHAAGVLALTLTAERRDFGRGRAFVLVGYLAGITALLIYICVRRGVWWPVFGFWGLTANRLAAWWNAPDSAARKEGLLSWVFSPVFYVGAALLTTFAPLPALGVTPAVVADAGLGDADLWSVQPQRALAFGILYFGAQAVYRRRTKRSS